LVGWLIGRLVSYLVSYQTITKGNGRP